MEYNLKIYANELTLDQKAVHQVYTLLEQEAFSEAKVRIMPDVHAGAGCVIGFTADLGTKVIPNIVGVDIGCGVLVAELETKEIDLVALDNYIKTNIPSGFNVNSEIQRPFDLTKLYCYDQLVNTNRLALGIGSLGGGNHFIEVDKGSKGILYLLVHTGSRNLGKQVAELYQKLAVSRLAEAQSDRRNKIAAELKQEGRQEEIESVLASIPQVIGIPKELCYLEGLDRENYLHDMRLCQRYALLNREVIARKILKFLGEQRMNVFESVHNYIDDNNMIRKGAISAHWGEKIIIPLNMRDGALICKGLGNPDWNESAPHGAGRLMSRSEAKKTLELKDFQSQMSGIYTTTATKATIDEAPMAYKNAEEIIQAIGPTAEIIDLIKPIYNFKATE